MNPAKLAEEALSRHEKLNLGYEMRAEMREEASVYALLAIADALNGISHEIYELRRGFLSVEVSQG